MPDILPVAFGMAFTVDRVDHIVINTRDVDVTADWYVRVLGMRRETYRGDRTSLLFGRQKFNVRPTGADNWIAAEVDALGEMTSYYCRDPDGNLVEISTYARS